MPPGGPTLFEPRPARIVTGLLLMGACAPVAWTVWRHRAGTAGVQVGVGRLLADLTGLGPLDFLLVLAGLCLWVCAAVTGLDLALIPRRILLARLGPGHVTLRVSRSWIGDLLAPGFGPWRTYVRVTHRELAGVETAGRRLGRRVLVLRTWDGHSWHLAVPDADAERVVDLLRRAAARPGPAPRVEPFAWGARTLHAALVVLGALLWYRFGLHAAKDPALAAWIAAHLPGWSPVVWAILGIAVPVLLVAGPGRALVSRRGSAVLDADGVELLTGHTCRVVTRQEAAAVTYLPAASRYDGLTIRARGRFGRSWREAAHIATAPSDHGRSLQDLAALLRAELLDTGEPEGDGPVAEGLDFEGSDFEDRHAEDRDVEDRDVEGVTGGSDAGGSGGEGSSAVRAVDVAREGEAP